MKHRAPEPAVVQGLFPTIAYETHRALNSTREPAAVDELQRVLKPCLDQLLELDMVSAGYGRYAIVVPLSFAPELTMYGGRPIVHAEVSVPVVVLVPAPPYPLERTCVVCGCTDANACIDPIDGPCSWIEWDVCSSCTPPGRTR